MKRTSWPGAPQTCVQAQRVGHGRGPRRCHEAGTPEPDSEATRAVWGQRHAHGVRPRGVTPHGVRPRGVSSHAPALWHGWTGGGSRLQGPGWTGAGADPRDQTGQGREQAPGTRARRPVTGRRPRADPSAGLLALGSCPWSQWRTSPSLRVCTRAWLLCGRCGVDNDPEETRQEGPAGQKPAGASLLLG